MLEPAISSTYMLQYSIVDMNQLACWPMIKLKPEKNRFLSTKTYKLPLPVYYILATVFLKQTWVALHPLGFLSPLVVNRKHSEINGTGQMTPVTQPIPLKQ